DVPVAPAGPGASAKILSYRLTTGDVISVQVFGEKLGIRDRIDARGNINCALIGPVYVYDDTLEQAEQAIATAYQVQRILRHPRVTVMVEEYAERAVSVQGSVREPRRYPLPPETAVTLVDIIERAGGFTDVAHGTDVKVTRILPNGTTRVWDHLDVEDFLKGKLKDKKKIEQVQLILEPGDVVYVPERII
ncbi:MAG: polysaccharide biosynthesis/export family protein, partial [Opitutaceae bacterium]